MVELTVSSEVGLSWDTYGVGVGDLVNGTLGFTKNGLGWLLGGEHMDARLTRYHSQPVWIYMASVRWARGREEWLTS